MRRVQMQAGSCPRPPRVHRRCGSHPVRATLQQVAVVQQQQQPHNAVGGHIAPEPSTIANGRKVRARDVQLGMNVCDVACGAAEDGLCLSACCNDRDVQHRACAPPQVPVRLRQNTHLNGVDVLALQHGATHCEERAVAASKARAHRGQASAHEACLQHAAFTEHVQAQLVAGDGQASASDPGHSSLLVLLPPPEQDEDEQKLQHSEADTLDHQQVQGDAAVASARCRHRWRRRVRKPSSDEAPASASSLPVDPAAQQLTKAIVAAPGVLELRHLLATATVRLNHIHVSAALKRLTRIAAPSSVQHVVTHVHAPEDASGHASCGGGGPSEPAAQHLHADAAPEQVAGQQQQAGGDAIPLLQRPVQSDWVPQQQLVVSQRGLVVHLAQLAMLHREALAVKDAACIISSLARLRAPVKKSFYLRLMEPLWRRLDTPDVNAWVRSRVRGMCVWLGGRVRAVVAWIFIKGRILQQMIMVHALYIYMHTGAGGAAVRLVAGRVSWHAARLSAPLLPCAHRTRTLHGRAHLQPRAALSGCNAPPATHRSWTEAGHHVCAAPACSARAGLGERGVGGGGVEA